MIYPTLTIELDGTMTMGLIDTDFECNPIISVVDPEANHIFITLLTAFINQYNYGYSDAIDDGAFGDDNIFY